MTEGSEPDKTILFPDMAERMEASEVNPNMVLFLDTATRYTGYSFFEKQDTNSMQAPFQLAGYGIFKATGKKAWEERCLEITAKVSNIIHAIKPFLFVIEYPHFQNSEKGVQAAKLGSTLQLAYLCGRLTVAWEVYVTKILCNSKIQIPLTYLIEFRQWNGQLKKKHTCKRCKDHFGIEADPNSIENNFVDAIMLGKYFIETQVKGEAMKMHEAERVDL